MKAPRNTSTIATRARTDPAFGQALLEEAIALHLLGEVNTAKAALRTLVKGTAGYLQLAEQIEKPPKSLQRMLSDSGRLTTRNLAAIFQTLKDALHVDLQAKSLMRP